MNRKKAMISGMLATLILTLCIVYNSNAQINNRYPLLKWDNTDTIRWNDFRGFADSMSEFEAECVTSIERSFYKRNDSIFCIIHAWFNAEKSWKKQYVASAYDLSHERLHFDITEVFARRLRQAIMKKGLNEESLGKAYDDNTIACNAIQDLYDKETNHSINKANQYQWNKKIQLLLSELNEYSDREIYLKYPICSSCWSTWIADSTNQSMKSY